ncbi:alpha/beta hydrolase [Williamsia sp.]|uniref:alpha/beta fold hydrolase n=1 Tax=Williamsia sp. TaxID=1872085 RepID=UPI001A1CE34B|nr:alpha/beta hydrolase [Williamsia sp.]MBJ7291681.1 alpha/beta hydrolase [Williamsia sp.]
MPEIIVAEGTIPYRIVGPAESDHPPVLFIHGVLADSRLWDRVADQLAARGYRCVLPDLPLGSHTTPLDEGATLSPRVVARIIRDLIVELDLADVTLVGNDSGGAFSQFVVHEFPDVVGRLVLTNCDAFEQFPPAPFKQVFALMRGPVTMRTLAYTMRMRLLRHSPLAYGALSHKADPQLTRSWINPCLTNPQICRDLVGLLRSVRVADMIEVSEHMSRFAKPVAIVWGQDDRSFTPRLGKRLADRFPNATYVPVPGARTFVALDEPDAVSSAIESVSAR